MGREGRGSGAKTQAPGCGVQVWARLHHSLAASHSGTSSSACMPRDNERKALAQGLASGSRWITRAPALAVGTGDAPSVAVSIVCRALGLHSAP